MRLGYEEGGPLEGFSEPAPFIEANLSPVPPTSGVHVVWRPTGEILFAGLSRKGQLARLRDHLAGDRDASVLHKGVGLELDQQLGRTATRDEIRGYLRTCEFAWRSIKNPGEVKKRIMLELLPALNKNLPGADRDVIDEEDEEFDGMDTYDPWDEFIAWAQRFKTWPGFDADERDYKVDVGRRAAEARKAVLDGSPGWLDLVKQVFAAPNNLVFHIDSSRFQRWVADHPEDASEALCCLWSETGTIGERIDAFLAKVPSAVLKTPGSRTGLSSLFLMGTDVYALPIYRPTPFNSAMALTGYEPPSPNAKESEIYVHALGFLDRIIEESKSRGLSLRDRLDAQAVLWSVTKASGLETLLTPEENERLARYRGKAPTTWWVNQGETFDEERRLGIVKASVRTGKGAILTHWLNVSRLQLGDVILHYRDGEIAALGVVARKARVIASNESDEQPRYEARVAYHDMEKPIALESIPAEWRRREANEEGGPFTVEGKVKQAYLLALSPSFADRIRSEFADRWPATSPWAPAAAWLFQANPEIWNLEENLKHMRPGDEDDWVVTRFAAEMRDGDPLVLWQAGSRAGVYAIGHLRGTAFTRSAPDFRDEPGKPESAIGFEVTEILDPPLLKPELAKHPILGALSVISAPQGTNFRVTAAQWKALEQKLHPIVEDASPGPEPKGLDAIARALDKEGLRIPDRTLRRFHIALRTRGFVVLAGVSGTGKTWLTDAYARAIGARYLLVPVAPNWTTNEDLLGYFNPIDRTYHDTLFSRFLREAAVEYENATKENRVPIPFLLALDEMNLARVEYYFARFLSAMEIRARRLAEIELAPGEQVTLPSNLLVVGTVNVDETTHEFADKVLDRLQVIELDAPRAQIEAALGQADHAAALLEIWDCVQHAAPFAFRIVDEVRVYVDQAVALGSTWQEALDEQILQKIVPKLRGSQVSEALERLTDLTNERFPLSHAKLSRMLDQLRRRGFASFF